MSQLRVLNASLRRKVAAVAAATAVAATTILTPGAAHAQDVPSFDEFAGNLSSDWGLDDLTGNVEDALDNVDEQARNQAWEARNRVNSQLTAVLNTAQAGPILEAIDTAVEAVFPGLIAERTAPAPEPEPEPAPAPPSNTPPAAPRVDRGSCPATARACVDLSGNRTWLQENGEISYGPVSHSPGRPEAPTPRGDFTVNRKVRDEVSWEFNNAPMPFAIYFTHNGHAFHAGALDSRSAGCVRLNYNDAAHYFDNVHIGDTVHIY